MILGVEIFLVCLMVILAMPINLIFSVHKQGAAQWSVVVCWLFGLVRIPMPTMESFGRRRRRKPERPRAIKRIIGSVFGGKDRIMPVLKSKGFMKRVVRLVKDLMRTVHVHRLGLHARLGLDDPADTGRLWGMVGPLAGLLSDYQSVDVNIEPEFRAETFDLDGEGDIRIIPLQIIFVIVSFLISPATLRAVKTLVVSRRK